MKNFILVSLLLTALSGNTNSANAQAATQLYLPNTTPPQVWANGKLQSLAWSGGLNNPQICVADLNNDGIKDLAIYDKIGRYGTVKTFINTSSIAGNPKYEYRPEFQVNFPLITDYMKMEDYNRDGVPDLFHKGMGGVSVHTGFYQNNKLNFKFYRELRYNLPGSGLVNCYVAPIDVPCIRDVDGDEDLDVITYDIIGSRITFYRNCEKEEGLPKDSMRMCLRDECWGRTLQLYERTINLGVGCGQWGVTCKMTGEEKTTHAGNTVCLVDYDGDGDLDLFNGNVSFSDIQFLKNGRKEFGKSIDTIISQDTAWGKNNGKQMFMPMMPIANWLDLDNDGKKDMVFSPRLENTENYKSISYYRNTGTNTNPSFSYVSDTFLMQDMIDIGSGAIPVYYDYNKDGKLDMFVTSEGYYQHTNGSLRSTIRYYENTSTATVQSFELKNPDFMGFFASNTKVTSLTFGDIDGDNVDDMLLGKGDGMIAYYRNNAATNNDPPLYTTSVLLNDQFGTMDVGDYAAPFLYDINNDGKKDLVVGSQNGSLFYFRNNGTASFVKVTDTLGGIRLTEEGSIYTYTVPYIGKIDNTGKDYLLLGSQGGTVYRYDGISPSNITKYTRLDSNYCYINVSQRSAPFVTDLDGDGKYEMSVGGYGGGVVMYRQYFNVGIDNIADNNRIVVYPNPAGRTVTIAWKDGFSNGNVDVKLVSVTGQVVKQLNISNNTTSVTVDVANLANGVYYCIAQSAGNQSVVPVSIMK